MMRLYLVLDHILCSVGLVHKIDTEGKEVAMDQDLGGKVSWTASGKEGLLEFDLKGKREVKFSLRPWG